MTPSTNPPALAVKLRRGEKRGGGMEILDGTTGKPVALILESEQAEVLGQLMLAASDLLWGVLRAASYINCDNRTAVTPEQRKVCKLLRDAFDHATKIPATK